MKFREKPIRAEAMQFDGSNEGSIADWMSGPPMRKTFEVSAVRTIDPVQLRIEGTNSLMTGNVGSWVVVDDRGFVSIMPPKVFAANYEPDESSMNYEPVTA